jgi:hypothetical protein
VLLDERELILEITDSEFDTADDPLLDVLFVTSDLTEDDPLLDSILLGEIVLLFILADSLIGDSTGTGTGTGATSVFGELLLKSDLTKLLLDSTESRLDETEVLLVKPDLTDDSSLLDSILSGFKLNDSELELADSVLGSLSFKLLETETFGTIGVAIDSVTATGVGGVGEVVAGAA